MATVESPFLLSLRHHATSRPGHVALTDISSRARDSAPDTFGEVWRKAESVASGLALLGVLPGDRVVLRLSNSGDFVTAFLGVLRLGGVVVPTIRQYTIEELAFSVADCEPTCIVTDGDYEEIIQTVAPSVIVVSTVDFGTSTGLDFEKLLQAEGGAELPMPEASADAVIFYTSGTTSKPKGVVLTHEMVAKASLGNVESWRITSEDTGYIVLPLFHCNALFMQLIPCLMAGASVVLDDRFSASRYLKIARSFHVTLANLTAGAIRSVMARPESADDHDSSLRLITFGLPLRAEEIEAFERRFGIPMVMCYGLTESSAGGTRTPLHRNPKSGWQSVGTAQSGWAVEIRDDDGAPVPAGEPGEIHLKGPGVMARYWNNPEATAQALNDGWLSTGDLGRVDAEGFLYFTSRKKDILKPKGENVSAAEVELVLEEHPGVAEAAVVGTFDPHHDEIIVAFIVPQGEGVSPEQLKEHCAERISSFKVPSRFTIVSELPRTAIGKINKGQLQRLLAAAEGG